MTDSWNITTVSNEAFCGSCGISVRSSQQYCRRCKYDQITKKFHYVIAKDFQTDRLFNKEILIKYDESIVGKLDALKDKFIKQREKNYGDIEEQCSKEIDKLLELCPHWDVLKGRYGYSIGSISLQSQPYIFSSHASTDDNVRKMVNEVKEKIALEREKHCDAYRELFSNQFNVYLREMESVATGITRPKNYCTSLGAPYTGLDYPPFMSKDVAFLDEVQIVDDVKEYYHALLLEEFYMYADARSEIIGYSHRMRGWAGSTEFSLDSKEEISLELKTNFGYGNSSYFAEILSVCGIKILNYSLPIYYRGIGATEYVKNTRDFEPIESSFKCCFDDAIEKYNEYKLMGKESFLVKHAKKSVDELAGLFTAVTKNSSFCQITELGLFNDLTNAGALTLVFDSEHNGSNCSLDLETERVIEKFVDALTVAQDGGLNAELHLFEELSEPFTADSSDSIIRQMRRLYYVRDRLKKLIHARFPGASEHGVKDVLKNVFPDALGYTVETYEGFNLIEFRIQKAHAVMRMLPNVQSLSKIVEVSTSYKQLIDSCVTISRQAKSFLENDIELEIIKEKKNLDSEVRAYGAYKDRHKSKSEPYTISRRDKEKIELLKNSINQTKKRLNELARQKRKIEQYLKKVASLS